VRVVLDALQQRARGRNPLFRRAPPAMSVVERR